MNVEIVTLFRIFGIGSLLCIIMSPVYIKPSFYYEMAQVQDDDIVLL